MMTEQKDFEISKEEVLKLNEEIDKIVGKNIQVSPIKKALDERPKTREELYNLVQKWLHIPDTHRIDVILAVTLTVTDKSDPLWVIFVGGSGDAKSELLRSLEGLPSVRKIDQLTANTFASGKVGASDLGSELQNTDTLLLFSDLACLTSLNKDEKKKIWSQFRTLFDGEIYKDTGSGVKKKYDNCNVTILACSTSTIKNEYHVHQQLGTRELLFDTEPDFRDNETKMLKALSNKSKKKEMRQELKEAMQGFLLDKKFNPDIDIPKHILEFIFKKCNKLRLLRATGKTDWKTGEIDGDVEAEVTTRLVQQFALLYQALHSLDPKYPDERYEFILERFVKSSSQPIRYKLYEFFKKNTDWITIYGLHEQIKNSRISIASQCESLWNLGSLKKEFREESVGYEGSNRWRQVAYYRPVFSKQEEIP